MNTYHMPGIVVSTGNEAVKKADKNLHTLGIYILVGMWGKIINKVTWCK